jgi:hypothetical protein
LLGITAEVKKVSGIAIIKNNDARRTTNNIIGNTNLQYNLLLTLGLLSLLDILSKDTLDHHAEGYSAA